jgi:hypothetical protein
MNNVAVALDEIQATVEAANRDSSKPTKIIIAGDLNRHHPAWNNRQVYYLYLRHSEELLAFIQDHRLGWATGPYPSLGNHQPST